MSVSISALMSALPVMRLRPRTIGMLHGLVEEHEYWGSLDKAIELYEPPAGKKVPFLFPDDALAKMFCYLGVPIDNALHAVSQLVEQMQKDISGDKWVVYCETWWREGPIGLSVFDFVNWQRFEGQEKCLQYFNGHPDVATEILSIISALEKLGYRAITEPTLSSIEYGEQWFSLETWPTHPSPESMIEFVMPTWYDGERSTDLIFKTWIARMRTIFEHLEKELGEPVYHFQDPYDDLDNECAHRFLMLHWCCTFKPKSPFVQYLLRSSGARDIEELKQALIDPDNYLPYSFKMHDAHDYDGYNEYREAPVHATYTQQGIVF